MSDKSFEVAIGVVDTPYDETGVTTGDVAGYLEKEYGLMATFLKTRKHVISTSVVKDLKSGLRRAMRSGTEFSVDVPKTQELIRREYAEYLNSQEHGIVTKASLARSGGRRGNGKKARGISFVDTGAYRDSVTAWIK